MIVKYNTIITNKYEAFITNKYEATITVDFWSYRSSNI